MSNLIATNSIATEHILDLQTVVKNATKHSLKFCYTNQKYCESVLPGLEFSGGEDTAGDVAKHFEWWLNSLQVEICGNDIPLKMLGTFSVSNKDQLGRVWFKMTITEESYSRNCKVSRIPQSNGN